MLRADVIEPINNLNERKKTPFGALSHLRGLTKSWLRGRTCYSTCLTSFLLRVLHEFYNCSLALPPSVRHYVSESRSTGGTSFGNRAINEVEK